MPATRPSHVVLGTHNPKKAQELTELLAPHGILVKSLADFDQSIEVVEDGDTFAANAKLKAVQQARHLKSWVIGEDSGLCVDALRGAPGIFSARFAGADATDEQNNKRLISELTDVGELQRTAFYVCHVTLANPDGVVLADCEATCRGRIRRVQAGTNGFGYDPLFEIVELHQTFGQLGPSVKAILSHRARAMRRFVPLLVRALNQS